MTSFTMYNTFLDLWVKSVCVPSDDTQLMKCMLTRNVEAAMRFWTDDVTAAFKTYQLPETRSNCLFKHMYVFPVSYETTVTIGTSPMYVNSMYITSVIDYEHSVKLAEWANQGGLELVDDRYAIVTTLS